MRPWQPRFAVQVQALYRHPFVCRAPRLLHPRLMIATLFGWVLGLFPAPPGESGWLSAMLDDWSRPWIDETYEHRQSVGAQLDHRERLGADR